MKSTGKKGKSISAQKKFSKTNFWDKFIKNLALNVFHHLDSS